MERDKQAIDVGLFLTLARVLNTAPAELLEDAAEGDAALATRIATMQSRERTKFWNDLSEQRREQRLKRRADMHNVGLEVEELLAQMDFLRQEIESVRIRLVKKH